MDVSASTTVAISGTRYGPPSPAPPSPVPQSPLPQSPPPQSPPPTALPAARQSTPAGGSAQLSAAFTASPSPPPGEIAAAVKRLPPNIRYAPSHPPLDADAATAFDRSA